MTDQRVHDHCDTELPAPPVLIRTKPRNVLCYEFKTENPEIQEKNANQSQFNFNDRFLMPLIVST